MLAFIATLRNITPIFNAFSNTPLINSLLSFVLSMILGVVIFLILKKDRTKKAIIHVFNKTGNDFILHDIISKNNGSNIKLTFKNADYYLLGQFFGFDKPDGSGWIAVKSYIMYDLQDNVITDYSNDPDVYFSVRFDDIKTMEVY